MSKQKRIRIEKKHVRPADLDLYPMSNKNWKQFKADREKQQGTSGLLQNEIDVIIEEINDILDEDDEPLPPIALGGPLREIYGVKEDHGQGGVHTRARGCTYNGLPDRRQSLYREEEWLPPSASPDQWPIMFCAHCSRRAVIFRSLNKKKRVNHPMPMGETRFTYEYLDHLDARCVVHFPPGDPSEVGGENLRIPISWWTKVRGLTLPQHRALRQHIDGDKIYAASPVVAFLDREQRANYLLRRAHADS